MNSSFCISIIFSLLLFGICPETIVQGLASQYPFSYDYSDQSGNSNQCKNNGATLTADRFGNQNSAYSFNGVNNQMICPIKASTFENDWTISAWVYRRIMTPWGGIVSNNYEDLESPVLVMNESTNQIGVFGDSSLTGTFVDLGSDNYNNWVFATITSNVTHITVFTNQFNNGIYFSSSSSVHWANNWNPTILIGEFYMDNYLFNGIIDEVRIQNRSISINEIWSLYCFPFNYSYENNTQKCLTNCSDGYFMNFNNTCELCNSSCRTCNISAIKCTGCFNDSALLNGECLISCPKGFNLVNSKCVFAISNLVSYYPFNDGLIDLSGSGNDCRNAGTKDALLSKDRFGNIRSALDFDGQSTYLWCPIQTSALINDWTIAVWFNHRLCTSWGTIISNNLEHNPNSAVITLVDYSNWIGLADASSSGIQVELDQDHFHKWTFMSMAKREQKLTLFLKEFDSGFESFNTTSVTWQMNVNPNILIGNFWNHQLNIFDGLIDDVYIFNRALNDEEIITLYCFPNNFIQENSIQRCNFSCNEGYFMNQSQCAKCNNSCKTCNISANKCTSCYVNSYLYMGQCLTNCPFGFRNENSQCVFQIEGLAAQQPFSGDSLDQSGNNQDCINNGGIPSFDRFGNPKSSYVFDGIKDHMKCLMIPSHMSGSWTITAWFKHRSVTSWGAIVSNNAGQLKEGPGLSFLGISNKFGISDFGISDLNFAYSLSNLHYNKWYFVSMRQNPNVNGVDICAINEVSCELGNIQWTLKTSPINWIARIWDFQGTTFDGFIDDIAIFNNWLTDADIWALFCWPFEAFLSGGLGYKCLSNCQVGFFMNMTNLCSECNSPCLTCNLTADSCTSCPSNLILFNKQCVETCPLGFMNSSSNCVSVISGLVSYYPFSGDTNDLSGNMNDCVNYNAKLTKDRFGVPNSAYSFDGKTSYIQCSINPLSLSQDWTITAWINHKGVTDYGTIISNNIGVNQAVLFAMMGKNNYIGIDESASGVHSVYADLGPDHFFKWVFVSIQKQVTNLMINWIQFADGSSLNVTETLNFVPNLSPSILIGKLWNIEPGLKVFQGEIDDVRIQNYSLGFDDIFTLYCFPQEANQQNKSCKSQCNEGSFMNGTTCSTCNLSLCKSCNLTQNNCLSCYNSLFLFQGKCIEKCPSGFTGLYSKCVSANSQLAAYFSFDNDILDHSGNSNECVNQGAIPAIDRFNKNAALSFDGESSYLICQIPKNTFEGDWTITAWIYHRTMTSFAGIVSNNNLGKYENPIITMQSTTTKIGVNDAGIDNDIGVFIDLGYEHQNKWTFVAVTKQNNNLTVHSNLFGGGTSLFNATSLLAWQMGTNSYLEIGRNMDLGVFDGIIDDVRIQNKSLNAQELVDLQNHTCTQGFQQFSNNSSCLEQCPEGQFIKIGDCLQCNKNCRTCDINETNCTGCNEGQGLYKRKCVFPCPDGFFMNQSTCFSKISGLGYQQPFDKDVLDQSGNDNDCINNSATPAIDRFNNTDGAFLFNGMSSSIRCPIKTPLFNNDWTISCWINQFSLTSSAGIISNIWMVPNSPGLQQKELEKKIGMIADPFNIENGVWLDLGENYLNKWLFVVMKNESSKISIYSFQKGESLSQTEKSLSWTYDNSDFLIIGRKQVYKTFKEIFNGSIDEIRIFNRSISEDEIFQLFCFPNMFYHPENFSCLQNCATDAGFYLNGTQCISCNSTCKACSSSQNNCTQCFANFGLLNSSCQSACPEGQQMVGNLCKLCNLAMCKTCNISSNICLSCQNATYLYNNTCLDTCPEGQFIENNSECIKCNLTCKTCLNSFNQCTSCYLNFTLDSLNNCIPNCPNSFQFYSNETKQCEACRDINCEICPNSKKCTKCKKGYAINWKDKDSSICERPFCLTNEYRFNGSCFPCSEHCKTCISDNICSSCQTSYGLAKYTDDFWSCANCSVNETWINGFCLLSCLADEYLNLTSNRCEKCVQPCKYCMNKTACSSCISKYQLTETKECIENCPANFAIDIVNETSYCSKCQIKNCNKCATIIDCKECANATQLQNGKCVYQCPSSMPASSQNKCGGSVSSNESNDAIEAIKDEFTQSLLSIFSGDQSINSIDLDNIVLSQDSSASIIEAFMKLTDESTTNLIDDLMSNSVVGNIIETAVKNSFSAQSNVSIQEIFDNNDKIKSLCEATKLSSLLNYSANCMEIAGSVKNEKMTLEQTKSLLGLIILTAKPRTIKEKANNSTKIGISQEDLQSTSQKTNLLDILNSASNSLCIRSTKNMKIINQAENNVQFLFQNISISPTIVQLNYSTLSVDVKLEGANNSNMLIKAIEMDQWLEVVPKNNESFASSVVYCQILKFCTDALQNENQPSFLPENLNISINFSKPDSRFSNFSNEQGFYCAFLHPDNTQQVNDKILAWEHKGIPQIYKENGNAFQICGNQGQLGFYALLQNKSEATETTKSNASSVLTITLCVVGAVLLGGGAFLIIWYCRKKTVSSIKSLETSPGKEKENQVKNKPLQQQQNKEKERHSKKEKVRHSKTEAKKEKEKATHSKKEKHSHAKEKRKEQSKIKKNEKNKK